MSIYDQLPPPQSGDYPDWFKFETPGQVIEGTVVANRIGKPSSVGDDPYPIIEVQLDQPGPDGQPVRYSVGCGAAALYRQVYALRPEPGGRIRITFTGYAGQAKLFDVQYAPGNGPAAAVAAPPPAPAPAPAPQGFGQPQQPGQPPAWGGAPASNTVAAPAPGPAPWGQ